MDTIREAATVMLLRDAPELQVFMLRRNPRILFAPGASVFPGARIGTGAEVRINGVVHVNSVLPEEATVPIGWVAVGDPAHILPPSDHAGIAAVQQTLDFVGTVYGVPRGSPAEEMGEITRRYADLFGRHRDDRVIG